MRVWRHGSRVWEWVAVGEIALLWGGAWLAVSLVGTGLRLRPVDVGSALACAAAGIGFCRWMWADRAREATAAARRFRAIPSETDSQVRSTVDHLGSDRVGCAAMTRGRWIWPTRWQWLLIIGGPGLVVACSLVPAEIVRGGRGLDPLVGASLIIWLVVSAFLTYVLVQRRNGPH